MQQRKLSTSSRLSSHSPLVKPKQENIRQMAILGRHPSLMRALDQVIELPDHISSNSSFSDSRELKNIELQQEEHEEGQNFRSIGSK